MSLASSADDPRCVACGSGTGEYQDLWERDHAFRLWTCGACGTESWKPTGVGVGDPSHSEYWDLQRFESYEHSDVVEEYRARYGQLGALTGLSIAELRGCSVADWGGGIGNLAKWASELGVDDVTVLDTDDRALDIARRRGLSTCLVDDLAVDRVFDVIFAIDVIEHVIDPSDFLAGLDAHLRPGGVIVLETPNSGFWMRSIARHERIPVAGARLRHFLYYYEHKHYFSVMGLATLGAASGFSVRDVRLANSPRSKIAAAAFSGTSTSQELLKSATGLLLAAIGRRNKVWIALGKSR